MFKKFDPKSVTPIRASMRRATLFFLIIFLGSAHVVAEELKSDVGGAIQDVSAGTQQSHSEAIKPETPKEIVEQAFCSIDTGLSQDEKSIGRIMGGACFSPNGSVVGNYQSSRGADQFSATSTKPFTTVTFTAGMDISHSTNHGPIKLSFSVIENWSSSAGSGWDKLPSLSVASFNYLGFTAGYSSSLLGFWSSYFNFTTSAPNLSSYLANYEYAISDKAKLALGIEAGPPVSFGSQTWQLPTSAPYITSRFRFSADGWTIHVGAAAHQPNVSIAPDIPGSDQRKMGWATVLGAQVPFRVFGNRDSISLQGQYGVNSPRLLGTTVDRSRYNSYAPNWLNPNSLGWSAIASYQHFWNNKWASNIMGNYLYTEFPLTYGTPVMQTTRAATNIIYTFSDYLTATAEAGYVQTYANTKGCCAGFLDAKNYDVTTKFGQQWTFIFSIKAAFY